MFQCENLQGILKISFVAENLNLPAKSVLINGIKFTTEKIIITCGDRMHERKSKILVLLPSMAFSVLFNRVVGVIPSTVLYASLMGP